MSSGQNVDINVKMSELKEVKPSWASVANLYSLHSQDKEIDERLKTDATVLDALRKLKQETESTTSLDDELQDG